MGKSILIADDARMIRKLVKQILTEAGLEVVGEAEDGYEVVELYKELKPDLVTMDLNMPEMGGMEAIKQILSLDTGAKIIVVTSLGQELLAEDAIKSGAKAFIGKPFKPHELIQLVNNVLDG